jgi:2,4'-dihydroxyacetophenone dioxygenase
VAAVTYAGTRPYGMADDFLVPGALALDTDERLWVPQAEGVQFRPLILSASQGYFVNILRVRLSGILPRHRHAGAVHAFTLRGRWHYLEYDWWAEEGGHAFEPPGHIHTLEVPADVAEMATLFHVTGAYTYVDPAGNTVGIEDVFSKIEQQDRKGSCALRRRWPESGLRRPVHSLIGQAAARFDASALSGRREPQTAGIGTRHQPGPGRRADTKERNEIHRTSCHRRSRRYGNRHCRLPPQSR